MTERGTLRFQYPVYPDLKALPNDNRAYALWYYYTLAMKTSAQIGDGSTEAQFGILEHEQWLSPHYEQQARTVALMYGFENPGVFMEKRFWQVVERQAYELGLPAPTEDIMRPLRLVMHS